MCIYRNETALREAVTNKKPLALVIIKAETGSSAEACAVFKRPHTGKGFGWLKIDFDDTSGVQKCGLWCAPLELREVEIQPPESLDRLKKSSRMSGLAIPLHYGLGRTHEDAFKYCVLTNWWKERSSRGIYTLPTLDFERHQQSAK